MAVHSDDATQFSTAKTVHAERAHAPMDVQTRRKILLDGMGKLDVLGIEDDALTNRLNGLPERLAPAPATAKLGKDAVLNLPKGTTVKVTDRPPSGAPSDADADSSPAKEQKPPWMKAEKLGTLDDLVNEEPPPPASVAVVTGSATALERVFHSAEFPQSSRGFGERTIAPNPVPSNRSVSVILPPGSKHWQDQRITWERVQGGLHGEHASRGKGKPPRLWSHSLQGVSIPQACYDQMLKMQANLFALSEENNALAGTAARWQAQCEALRADLALAVAQVSADDL